MLRHHVYMTIKSLAASACNNRIMKNQDVENQTSFTTCITSIADSCYILQPMVVSNCSVPKLLLAGRPPHA